MLIDFIIILLESKLSLTDQFVLKVIFAYLYVLLFLLVNHFNHMVRAYQVITYILVINKYRILIILIYLIIWWLINYISFLPPKGPGS
jgi:hypothetical protein